MAKKDPKREEQWAEAKRRCSLSVEQLRRAKEMGLNPLKLIKNIPAPTQEWKLPVGDWIDGIYEKRQEDTARNRARRAMIPGQALPPRDSSILPQPWPVASSPASTVREAERDVGNPAKRKTGCDLSKREPSTDPFHYRIKLSTELSLESREADSHLLKYAVTLLGDEDAEDGTCEPKYVRIGSLRVWRFLVGAYWDKADYSLFDLFDADSDEAMQLFYAVFDPDSEEVNFSLTKSGLIGDCSLGTDILHFQWGDLPPAYRRSNVALALVERTIDAIGGGCFAATLWPWDAPVPALDTASTDDVLAFFASQQANEDHWGKIGFRRIPGTAILIRDLNLLGWKVESLMGGKYDRLSGDTRTSLLGEWRDSDEEF